MGVMVMHSREMKVQLNDYRLSVVAIYILGIYILEMGDETEHLTLWGEGEGEMDERMSEDGDKQGMNVMNDKA